MATYLTGPKPFNMKYMKDDQTLDQVCKSYPGQQTIKCISRLSDGALDEQVEEFCSQRRKGGPRSGATLLKSKPHFGFGMKDLL